MPAVSVLSRCAGELCRARRARVGNAAGFGAGEAAQALNPEVPAKDVAEDVATPGFP